MVEKILLVAINAKYIHSNLAVHSLKACAGEYSPVIDIAEFTINNQIEDILDEIYIKKPEVLAFSCYIWNMEYVKKLIVELKKLLPDTHIWLGGPEVSYNTDFYFDNYPQIEGIMVGEGEASFKELAEHYVEGRSSFEDIKGIALPRKRKATERECMDMSQLAFPYKELKEFENRIIYYESSRGCPFSCSYCLSSIDKKLRFRDEELVKNELKFFLENKVKQVKFIDRTFNTDKVRSRNLWRFISDNDNGVTNFHFEISADLLDEAQLEILNKMRPGLVQLEIGVQSTNEQTISAIKRTMKLDKLKETVAKLKSAGNIHLHLDLIAGLPYEDILSFKNSFNEVYSMSPDELQLGFLKVLHGTYMHAEAKNYGIVYKDFPPYEVLYTNWLSYDDILKLKKIEEVLEIYFGSGQFRNTVNFLIKYYEAPYDFYEKLGDYYEAVHKKGEKHARIERYKLLLGFASSNTEISQSKLKEIMTLDLYLRENMKTRPGFSREMASYRDSIRMLVSGGKAEKSEHIEVFSKEVAEEYLDMIPEADEVIVKFDYENRNPVTMDAKVIYLGRPV